MTSNDDIPECLWYDPETLVVYSKQFWSERESRLLRYTLNQQAVSHDLKAAENDGIVKGVAHVGAYLVDKYEKQFNGGEDEIAKFCDDIALSLTGSAATSAPVEPPADQEAVRELRRSVSRYLEVTNEFFTRNPEESIAMDDMVIALARLEGE